MSKLVLVVDDEMEVSVHLSLALERRGYRAVMAANGVDGFDKAKEFNPHLIILDVMMPKRNGISTLEGIRRDHELRDTPVIMLTSIQSFIEQAEDAIDDPEIIRKMRYLLNHVDSTIERFFLKYTSYRKLLLMERRYIIEEYRKKEASLQSYMPLPDMFVDKPIDYENFMEAVAGLLE
ncbi:MAG: response regulator [Nitrospirae bacterium]|nr:response regulator [Nitrospirota bacterium]